MLFENLQFHGPMQPGARQSKLILRTVSDAARTLGQRFIRFRPSGYTAPFKQAGGILLGGQIHESFAFALLEGLDTTLFP